jgi:hypothetical protein
MAPKKPANKISPGRKPKPPANNIRNMNQDVTNTYDNRTIKKLERKAQRAASRTRNTKPVGPNANNAVYSRSNMMGGATGRGTLASGALLTAGTPVAKKIGQKLGTKLGKALRPVGRAIDKALGPKPKAAKKPTRKPNK